MFVLGLTGSIATGKSTVLAMFEAQNIPVYSADTAVHELYAGEAAAQVGALFPGIVVDGVVDRQKLAAQLVANPERIGELEALVHPLVRQRMLAFLERVKKEGADLAVLEVPLLLETGNPYPIDALAVTACSDEDQRRRALLRPGMTVDKLETILARQIPQADKKDRADFVIDTGTSLDATRGQVEWIVGVCRSRNGQIAK